VGVNSMHHQAIGRVGEGLIAAATTADGLVEAVVGDGAAFVVGVQWHPEHLRDTEAGRALFDAFAAACGRA
ncbi:MAG: gamma-glutamyl-gamma-aminobutyrate hydrolase family protein, partial [Firmicutes bacterium]|nr:gamma-glutamyl-gamma-aminobutyrate hydrolase family protein [Bacillota bacterium]